MFSGLRISSYCLLLSVVSVTSPICFAQRNGSKSFGPAIQLAQFDQQDTIEPIDRRSGSPGDPNQRLPSTDDSLRLPNDLLGNVNQIDQLPADRKRFSHSPASDAVFGAEAQGRESTDIGDLLRKAISAHGVTTQERTPIVTDTRIRGQRVGQVLASGSYWTPVRMDLDTMMNKIDSRLLSDVILIKGPYSSRYGPGFRFVDFDLIKSPRYEGLQSEASTSFDYDTNGQGVYGRQSVAAGSNDWGIRASYGHRTGNDYETGAGTYIPASYKSRDLFIAVGWDPSPHKHLEFNYLRLDQTDMEFPGLVYDINFLVTDGYELTYVDTAPVVGDLLEAEVWYNRTRFAGDTLRPSKARQIPNLSTILYSDPPGDGYAITDGDGSSLGYRLDTTYGRDGEAQSTIGVSVIHLRQNLNDIEPLLPDPDDNNFPIPPSQSTDFGVFLEELVPVNDWLTLTAGARFDIVFTDADSYVDGLPFSVEDLFDVDDLDREYYLWSAFVTANVQLTESWFATLGCGHGQRPPTLTELYTLDSFIGSLQRGLTALGGDPLLDPERMTQLDLAVHAKYEDVQVGLRGYFSWIDDFITYDLLAPAGGAGGLGGFASSAAFVNTDEAIIAGFEGYGEAMLLPGLTSFAMLSYIEGRDLSRDAESRLGFPGRSGIFGLNHEPLPGIAPMESRLGIRLHDPSPQRSWGIELAARIVDNQDRVALSLEEIETPGFTTYDIRFYKRQGAILLTAGCENFTDKYYREHLDYRSGLGVYRPGINFYSGAELFY